MSKSISAADDKANLDAACRKRSIRQIYSGRLKNEIFYGREWVGVTIDEFINEIDEYINRYNTKRIKQSLGFLSPMEYRQILGLSL